MACSCPRGSDQQRVLMLGVALARGDGYGRRVYAMVHSDKLALPYQELKLSLGDTGVQPVRSSPYRVLTKRIRGVI
jgi:hypothetical protein